MLRETSKYLQSRRENSHFLVFGEISLNENNESNENIDTLINP